MRFVVDLNDRSYPIFVGRNTAADFPSYYNDRFGGRSCAVVTNETIAAIYPSYIKLLREKLCGGNCAVHVLPDGEKYKTVETWSSVIDTFVASRLDRKSVVVAFGGGVVGDMAGFAAAAFMRGVEYVQMPTTLLAMVDSSVGGKTAVDHPQGKNLIGAFHQPAAVWIDTDFLTTLPRREFIAGYAEAFKYAFIGGREMFDFIMDNKDAILNSGGAVGDDVDGAIVDDVNNNDDNNDDADVRNNINDNDGDVADNDNRGDDDKNRAEKKNCAAEKKSNKIHGGESIYSKGAETDGSSSDNPTARQSDKSAEKSADKSTEKSAAILTDCVIRSIRIKADVVRRDEFETAGARALLNFGHTFGHALEQFYGFEKLLHGEAVLHGMVCAVDLAKRTGTLDAAHHAEFGRLLAGLPLPPLPTPPRTDAVYEAMFADKKAENRKLRFILPVSPGESAVIGGIAKEAVLETLEKILKKNAPA